MKCARCLGARYYAAIPNTRSMKRTAQRHRPSPNLLEWTQPNELDSVTSPRRPAGETEVKCEECDLSAGVDQSSDYIIDALQRAGGSQLVTARLQSRKQTLRKAQIEIGRQVERLTEAYLISIIRTHSTIRWSWKWRPRKTGALTRWWCCKPARGLI